MAKIDSVRVVEPAIQDKKIKPTTGFLVCDPVDDLEDLLFWEDRLSKLKVDYMLAEFDYISQTSTKRMFGIFANLKKVGEI